MVLRTANDLVIDIERRIGAGQLRPGARLEPIRTVAARTGLAPNTVAAAYRKLRDRGVVIGRGRQGTVVVDRPPIGIRLDKPVAEGLIDVASGNPSVRRLPPRSGQAHDTRDVRYGDHPVDPALVDLASDWFADDGVDAGPVTVTSGALDAIERVLVDQLRPGDRVAVEDPGYAAIHQLATGTGLVPVPVAIDERGPVPASFRDACASGVRAAIVTPRAQNPTGAAFDQERVAMLRDVLREHPDILVIEDDHASTAAGVPFVTLNNGRARWCVVRSVAKTLGPDLRLALATGDAGTIGRLEGRFQLGPGWVSHVLQREVRVLLSSAATHESIARAAAHYGELRRSLIDALGALGVDGTGRSGLNVWIPVDDEDRVITALADRGWGARAGSASRLQSSPAIRVTVAELEAEQVEPLAEAIAEAVQSAAITRIDTRLG